MSDKGRLTSPGTPPSAARLLRSTVLAALGATVVLVLFVLPAGYGYDLTGLGRMLGLTQRGELNMMLAEEAAVERRARATRLAADSASDSAATTASPP